MTLFRLLLLAILGPIAAAWSQVAVLDNFNNPGATGSILSGTSWVNQTTRTATTLIVGGNARNDSGWGAIGVTINATGMTHLSIIAQRDAGHGAANLIVELQDAELDTHQVTVPTSSFAVGALTTVNVPLGAWGSRFNPAQITGWSIGGGTPPTGLLAFRMTFDHLSLVGGAAPSATPTHAIVGSGYVAGSTLTVTNTLSFSGGVGALAWQATLPSGWSLVSSSGSFATQPAAGATGSMSWTWSNPPPSPITFTYTVNVPAGTTGDVTISAGATLMPLSGAPVTQSATPNPLVVSPVLHHAADTNRDFAIDLNELLRVISLYNTRFTSPEGLVQTGCYRVQIGTIDGFATDTTRTAPAAPGEAGLSRYHSADTNRDGAIDLNELLRMISLYNTRFTSPEGLIQTGFYRVQGGTIDGYAPDPTRAPTS